MNAAMIARAVREAEKFLERAATYKANTKTSGSGEFSYTFVGTKESGALRRASMDLTRALADMRRPG